MINPTTHAITEFRIPTPDSYPSAITAGPDGNLWFTESHTNKIGMLNPTSHLVTEFSIPTSSSYSLGITAGPDGNLWFTEDGADKIGQVVIPDHPPIVQSPSPAAPAPSQRSCSSTGAHHSIPIPRRTGC